MKQVLTALTIVSLLAGPGCRPRPRGFTIGFMPKLTGIPYFEACAKGAREAAVELGVALVYDGPTSADSNQQIDLINNWSASGRYDCLAIACVEEERVTPALKKARAAGLPVVTYDADARPEARQFFVNMATYDAVARAMADVLAEQMGKQPAGKVGILTSSLQAPNQAQWAKRLKAYVKEKYPGIQLLPEETHGEDRALGVTRAEALLDTHKDLKGIIGLTSVAVPAAAEAVRRKKRTGEVIVTGVSTPKDMRDYVKDGTVREFVLWSPIDLGYLTVHVCHRLHQGRMVQDGTIEAGRLGKIRVNGGEVLLGAPMRFTRENIDRFDF